MFFSSSGLISVLGFCLALRCGHPSQVKQETMMLPTANWAPPKTGRAFAFASVDVVRVQFGCNVFVMTRVPASPQAQPGCAAGVSSDCQWPPLFSGMRPPIVTGCGGDAEAQALEKEDSEKVGVGLW